MDYKIEVCTASHIGDRAEQQDRVGVFSAPRYPGCLLAVVADGIGGLSGGKLAAEQILLTAEQLFNEFVETDSPIDFLHKVVLEAHHLIKLTANSSEKEPHSTLVALLLLPTEKAYWVHAGDSRLYYFRRNQLRNRTTDDSLVQAMFENGLITQAEMRHHPQSNVIFNVLGAVANSPKVQISVLNQLRAKDSFLLCTDGIWHYFSDEDLAEVTSHYSARRTCEKLIEKARSRAKGVGDNATLAVIKLITAQNKSV